MIVIYSPTAQLAASTLDLETPPALTLGAQYGAFVCEGTKYTSAWSQPSGTKYAENPTACMDQNIPVLEENDVVLISHMSPNILGGLMRASGMEMNETFWEKVNTAELKGLHHLIDDDDFKVILGMESLIADVEADFRKSPLQNEEVTDLMMGLIQHLQVVLEKRGELEGETWDNLPQEIWGRGVSDAKRIKDLNASSLISMTKLGILVRKSRDGLMNHLFSDPDGNEGVAIISYNENLKSITISLADRLAGLSCKDVAEELWGQSDTGSAVRATSPINMSEANFYQTVEYFTDRLVGVLYG